MPIRVIGNGNNTSVSAWRWVGKPYGFTKPNPEDESKPHSSMEGQSIDDWFKLSVQEKIRLNNAYKEAVDYTNGIHRNATKINLSWTREDVKNQWDKQRAIMNRLAYLQVEKADSLFVIGHISAPGEKVVWDNDVEIINNASISTVDGTDGVYVRYATTLRDEHGHLKPIPVHVWDTEKSAWFTWNGKAFLEEETPVLTNNTLLTGKNSSEKGFYKALGNETMEAMKDVFTKTFGFEALAQHYGKDTRGLDVTELGELRQALNEEASKYETDISDVHITTDNPMSKLSREIDPHTRLFRTEMIARDFSATIDNLLTQDRDDGKAENDYYEAEEALKKFADENKPAEDASEEEQKQYRETLDSMSHGFNKLRKYKDILSEGNEAIQRRAVIQHYGLDAIFQIIKDKYTAASESDRCADYSKVEFKKVVDNFDILIQDALEKVQYLENFRIIPFKKSSKDKLEGEVGNS